MKVRELRIGNIIRGKYTDWDDGSEKYDTCKVVTLDSVGAAEYPIWVEGNANVEKYEGFEPEPLTKGWLLKLGFTFSKELSFYYKGAHDVDLYANGVIEFYPFGDEDNSIKINHVHELQNLFFALTNKELYIQ
jgi:hypothetical protein